MGMSKITQPHILARSATLLGKDSMSSSFRTRFFLLVTTRRFCCTRVDCVAMFGGIVDHVAGQASWCSREGNSGGWRIYCAGGCQSCRRMQLSCSSVSNQSVDSCQDGCGMSLPFRPVEVRSSG
jgi:hypothetical protein